MFHKNGENNETKDGECKRANERGSSKNKNKKLETV